MRKSALVLILSSISFAIFGQTLQSSVQHAMMSNPDILQNKAKSLAAAQAVRAAEGAYMPAVDVKLALGKEQTQTPITTAIGGAQSDDPMTRKESSIEINQNIFSGFALTGEAQRLYHLWRAQEFKTLGVAEDLSLEVTEKYLDVLRYQQLLMLARENLNEHQRIYEKIELRTTAGVGRQAELEQAKSRLALANATFLSVQNDLRDARISFIRIVGESPDHLTWPHVPRTKELPKTLSAAIQHGLDNHPTLLSAHADILEAKAQHKVAKAQNYPKLDLAMDVRQNRNLDGLFGMNNEKLAILRLSYNVYRGGTDLAKQRETAYQIQEAYELKNNAVLQIEEKVRLAWYAWLTAGARMPHLRDHVSAARKTRLAYIEQFKIGKRSLLDVLDSQNELYQAKIEEENGKFEEVDGRYRILNAEGSLLPFLNGRLPVAVHNDDFATSHERINHQWLNDPLSNTPGTNLPEKDLEAQELKQFKHPNIRKHHVYETTEPKKPLFTKTWYVYVKKFTSPLEAEAFARELKRKGMKANFASNKNRESWVFLGPFYYRSQAGLAMNRLQKRTNLKGSIAIKHKLIDIDSQIIGQSELKGLLRAVTLSKNEEQAPTHAPSSNEENLHIANTQYANKAQYRIHLQKPFEEVKRLAKSKNLKTKVKLAANKRPKIKALIPTHKRFTFNLTKPLYPQSKLYDFLKSTTLKTTPPQRVSNVITMDNHLLIKPLEKKIASTKDKAEKSTSKTTEMAILKKEQTLSATTTPELLSVSKKHYRMGLLSKAKRTSQIQKQPLSSQPIRETSKLTKKRPSLGGRFLGMFGAQKTKTITETTKVTPIPQGPIKNISKTKTASPRDNDFLDTHPKRQVETSHLKQRNTKAPTQDLLLSRLKALKPAINPFKNVSSDPNKATQHLPVKDKHVLNESIKSKPIDLPKDPHRASRPTLEANAHIKPVTKFNLSELKSDKHSKDSIKLAKETRENIITPTLSKKLKGLMQSISFAQNERRKILSRDTFETLKHVDNSIALAKQERDKELSEIMNTPGGKLPTNKAHKTQSTYLAQNRKRLISIMKKYHLKQSTDEKTKDSTKKSSDVVNNRASPENKDTLASSNTAETNPVS